MALANLVDSIVACSKKYIDAWGTDTLLDLKWDKNSMYRGRDRGFRKVTKHEKKNVYGYLCHIKLPEYLQ